MPYAPPKTPADRPQKSSHARLSRSSLGGCRPMREYAANPMIRIASVTFTAFRWLLVRRASPSGMPNSVAKTSHPVLRTWISRQSCATTTAAIVIDTSTASGAAIPKGRRSASKGTANSASPNPNADRISVAINTTNSTCRVAASIHAVGQPRRLRRALSPPLLLVTNCLREATSASPRLPRFRFSRPQLNLRLLRWRAPASDLASASCRLRSSSEHRSNP